MPHTLKSVSGKTDNGKEGDFYQGISLYDRNGVSPTESMPLAIA